MGEPREAPYLSVPQRRCRREPEGPRQHVANSPGSEALGVEAAGCGGGTRPPLDAEGQGKSFENYVLGSFSFIIVFKTELSGGKTEGGQVEELELPSSQQPFAPARPPGVGASEG